tara:strand:+ start:8047 stop:8310 length:264 start_codon:yes stop_codon:yes gene_type:complete
MMEFLNEDGRSWMATVILNPGTDYKGRYHFYFHPKEGLDDEGVDLLDVRWNSRETAEKALATMSEVELRKRLRSALGRSSSHSLTNT